MDIDWKALFLSTSGRIKRQTYWIGWGCQFAAAIVLGLITSPISVYVGSIVGLALLYPLYCIYAKRLHDLGKPGGLAAIPLALAVVAQGLSLYMVATLGLKTGFAAMMGGGGANQEAMMGHMGTVMAISGVNALMGLVGLVFWLVLGIAQSQEGPNPYGPEPGSEDESTFD
jgi:uncharacterized membrane protein YhaH (DUF805 family)